MVVPFRSMKTYGEELYWWKPSPDAKGNLELIVRVYKNDSGQGGVRGSDSGVGVVE